ncbi:MAG: polyprenyl diphosphate synthase [Candidatus Tagabacteria bacterium]
MEETKKKKFHVFTIPDGNRRWAKSKGLPPYEGHRQGYETLRSILKNIWSLEVTHYTFWGLSMDNFRNRSKQEITFLFRLFEKAIDELLSSLEMEKEKVHFQLIGRFKELCSKSLKEKIEELEEKTSGYTDKFFTLLAGYNGDEELEDAVTRYSKKLCETGEKATWNGIREHLWSSSLPDVDICIRTGFEPHLSAAVLSFQMRDAHLYFPQMHWPDFNIEEMAKIIDDFKNRERRFGA